MLKNQQRVYSFPVIIFFIVITFTQLIQAKEFAFKREFENTPPAFEKFYVHCSDILSTPFGTYIKHPDGQLEEVRAIMTDYHGNYVMRVETQCPLCGECYRGKSSPEGTCCPLYDKEVSPGIWTSP